MERREDVERLKRCVLSREGRLMRRVECGDGRIRDVVGVG